MMELFGRSGDPDNRVRAEMRNVLSAVLVTVALASHCAAGESGQHLFILSGQSNMVGLDPAVSFTPAVIKEFGKENVIVLKDAHDGQRICRWVKNWKGPERDRPQGGAVLYDRMLAKVNSTTKDKPINSVTLVWMQGESDAKREGRLYAASLRALIGQLRADLARNDVAVVMGRIGDFKNVRFPESELVRQAQVAVAEADPLVEWVDTDELNGPGNAVHYTEEGYKALGSLFAEKAIELVRGRRK